MSKVGPFFMIGKYFIFDAIDIKNAETRGNKKDKIVIKWVQFLNEKTNFQKWFVDVINEFLNKGKQVFLFGDRSESEIELLGKLNNNTACLITTSIV